MKYFIIEPPKVLADYIQFFWVLEGSATAEKPLIHRALAESAPEWIFYCRGQFDKYSGTPERHKTFPSGIFGQTQHFKTFYTKDDFCLFGVYLFPYAIPGIFDIPAHALSDQAVETALLLGREGQLLEEKIFSASDHWQRAKVMSQFIQHRLAKSREIKSPVFTAIKTILFSSTMLSVSKLADNCFLSRRQFERKFIQYAGYSPKQFQRIARFHTAIKRLENRPASLTELAYDCGYYDQSHFIHDFQLFSGYSPNAFFKHQKEAVDYRAFEEFNF
jgi:AraC-like DNA-binding protein